MTKKKPPKPSLPAREENNKLNKLNNREKIQEYHKGHVLFSFQHLDYKKEEAFNLGGPLVDVPWFLLLMDHFQFLCKMTRVKLENEGKHFRFHPIDPVEEGYPFKHLPHDIIDEAHESAYQFGLGKSKGRVLGFMVDNEFYVIWLDRNHNFYPDDNHGGYKSYAPVATVIDILESRVRDLELENEKHVKEKESLKQDVEMLFQMLDEAEKKTGT